jgi:outer membrane protein assembly factor BamA
MKTFLLSLALFLLCSAGQALKISKLEFEADFPIDSIALATLSGIVPGTEFDALTVSSALDKLNQHFIRESRYYVRIPFPELIPADDGTLTLHFTLSQILDTTQAYLRYSGNRYFTSAKLHELLFTDPHTPQPLNNLPQIMERILGLYTSRAYLFASVQLDSLVMTDSLQAYIGITEGKLFSPTRYIFRGNAISRESALIKSSGLSRQKTITPAIINQAEQNIRSKSYIRDCQILPLDDSTLLLSVEEGRMTFLEGLLALGSTDEKTRLSGMLRIDFLNLWGSDRGIRLDWKQSPGKLGEIRLSYHESGHPDLPLAADFSLSRTTQDSLWIRSSYDVDVFYHSLYQKLGLSLAQNSILPGTGFSPIVRDKNTTLGALWKYSRLSGEAIPVSGQQAGIEYDVIFSKPKTYTSIQIDTASYIRLNRRWIGFAGTHIRNYDYLGVADYDLFTMGGYGSLRGYREDEFRSRRLAWANLELRYLIGMESLVYAFYDHGLFETTPNKLKTDVFGLGAGIKFGTRLGLLSLEYGLGYRDKRLSDFGLGMVHIGLDIAL